MNRLDAHSSVELSQSIGKLSVTLPFNNRLRIVELHHQTLLHQDKIGFFVLTAQSSDRLLVGRRILIDEITRQSATELNALGHFDGGKLGARTGTQPNNTYQLLEYCSVFIAKPLLGSKYEEF